MNPWKIYTVFSILSTWFTDFWYRNDENVRVIKRLNFVYHCFALRRIIPVWDVYLNCFFCCHALQSLHFLLSLAWKVPWLPSIPFIYGPKEHAECCPMFEQRLQSRQEENLIAYQPFRKWKAPTFGSFSEQ